MSHAVLGPRKGKESAAAVAYVHLEQLLSAARELSKVWDPVLDQGYPRYLPHFDVFLEGLGQWKEEVKERQDVVDDDGCDPVDFSDPGQVRLWLKALRVQVEDAVSAGDDATRPPGKRGLGRLTARRIALESRYALLQLLQAAELGLEMGPAPSE
jgi:hypothetical protein